VALLERAAECPRVGARSVVVAPGSRLAEHALVADETEGLAQLAQQVSGASGARLTLTAYALDTSSGRTVAWCVARSTGSSTQLYPPSPTINVAVVAVRDAPDASWRPVWSFTRGAIDAWIELAGVASLPSVVAAERPPPLTAVFASGVGQSVMREIRVAPDTDGHWAAREVTLRAPASASRP
jgi:hypothetical protein